MCGYAALSAAVGLTIQNYLSAKGGGRVASLVMPLKVLFTFLLWLGIDEAHPWAGLVMVVATLGVVFLTGN